MIKTTGNISGNNIERLSPPVSTKIKLNEPTGIPVSNEPDGSINDQVSAQQLFSDKGTAMKRTLENKLTDFLTSAGTQSSSRNITSLSAQDEPEIAPSFALSTRTKVMR
jgi:hypothetical protein